MILYSSKPSTVLFMKQLRQLRLLFSSNADTLYLLLRCFISVSVSSSDDDSLLLIPSHHNVTWSPLLTVCHMSSTSADVLMDTLQADTIVTCVQAFHSMFKRYLLFIYSNIDMIYYFICKSSRFNMFAILSDSFMCQALVFPMEIGMYVLL